MYEGTRASGKGTENFLAKGRKADIVKLHTLSPSQMPRRRDGRADSPTNEDELWEAWQAFHAQVADLDARRATSAAMAAEVSARLTQEQEEAERHRADRVRLEQAERRIK